MGRSETVAGPGRRTTITQRLHSRLAHAGPARGGGRAAPRGGGGRLTPTCEPQGQSHRQARSAAAEQGLDGAGPEGCRVARPAPARAIATRCGCRPCSSAPESIGRSLGRKRGFSILNPTRFDSGNWDFGRDSGSFSDHVKKEDGHVPGFGEFGSSPFSIFRVDLLRFRNCKLQSGRSC